MAKENNQSTEKKQSDPNDKIPMTEVLRTIFKIMKADQFPKRKVLKQFIRSTVRGSIIGMSPLVFGNMMNEAGRGGLANPKTFVWGGIDRLANMLNDLLWQKERNDGFVIEKQIYSAFRQYAEKKFLEMDPAFRLYTTQGNFAQAAMARVAHSTEDIGITGMRLAVSLATMFGVNRRLILPALVVGAATIVASMRHLNKIIPEKKESRKKSRESNRRIGDIAANASIIQRTDTRAEYGKIIDDELEEEKAREIKINDKNMAFNITSTVATFAGIIGAYIWQYFGGLKTGAEIGTVMTSVGSFSNSIWALNILSNPLVNLKTAAAEYIEAMDILNAEPGRKDKPDAIALDVGKLEKNPPLIEFKNVSHHYNDKDGNPGPEVLTDFSLKIPGGQSVALVGMSGSGKTTMLNLLLREYEQQPKGGKPKGEIWIDGHKNDDITLKSLLKTVRYIPQADGFLNASVRENLRLVKPNATDKEIDFALARAAISDAVMKKEGLDTQMGSNGNAFSGGERHRIALARAFLGEAPVMVFDEPTSDLDVHTARSVIENIKETVRGRTAIIVTHNPVAALDFDRVIMMRDGKIVSDGKPSELIKDKNGEFFGLVREYAGNLIEPELARILTDDGRE